MHDLAWGSKYFCVEVSRGCPENCSYCATRWAVGKLHSKQVEKCVSEIKLFNESNADKVVINGDKVGAYGLDIGESFGSLIQELPLVENGYSALIDSLHPKWLLKYYDSILDAAQKNTLGMIVSAIQSGSERIIKLILSSNSVSVSVGKPIITSVPNINCGLTFFSSRNAFFSWFMSAFLRINFIILSLPD